MICLLKAIDIVASTADPIDICFSAHSVSIFLDRLLAFTPELNALESVSVVSFLALLDQAFVYVSHFVIGDLQASDDSLVLLTVLRLLKAFVRSLKRADDVPNGSLFDLLSRDSFSSPHSFCGRTG
jgi:hypothetical protein